MQVVGFGAFSGMFQGLVGYATKEMLGRKFLLFVDCNRQKKKIKGQAGDSAMGVDRVKCSQPYTSPACQHLPPPPPQMQIFAENRRSTHFFSGLESDGNRRNRRKPPGNRRLGSVHLVSYR